MLMVCVSFMDVPNYDGYLWQLALISSHIVAKRKDSPDLCE